MKYRISYTASAKRDIRGIYEYIAYRLLEENTALVQTRRIIKAISGLEENP